MTLCAVLKIVKNGNNSISKDKENGICQPLSGQMDHGENPAKSKMVTYHRKKCQHEYSACRPNLKRVTYPYKEAGFVYENKGVQWLKSVPQGPIGLHINPAETSVSKTTEPTASATAGLSKTAKKNLKQKEKKKQQALPDSVKPLETGLQQTTLSEPATAQEMPRETGSSSVAQEPQKRLRNLRKKLKQIDELQAKLDSGTITEPTKEQQEKLNKKREIVDEIEEIGLDLDD